MEYSTTMLDFPNYGDSSFNWFSPSPHTQNDKIMDVPPLEDFDELQLAQNFTFDFNLPNLEEIFEDDVKRLKMVLPNREHSNGESSSAVVSDFVEVKVEKIQQEAVMMVLPNVGHVNGESSSIVVSEFVNSVKEEQIQQNPVMMVLPNRGHFNGESCSDVASVIVNSVKEEHIHIKPLKMGLAKRGHFNGESSSSAVASEFVNSVKEVHKKPLRLPAPSSKRKKTSELGFDDIKEHFGVPIRVAAEKLKVGMTLLKQRCRDLRIMRWPHRKIKSLQSVIDNVKVQELGFINKIATLEEQKIMVEKTPGLELNEETKRLRQVCFKAKHKKKRSLAPRP